ncbi:MAG: tight adherence protein [Frankiales bacterium]|nr:tight adherence protein [Frankiales bacterium]
MDAVAAELAAGSVWEVAVRRAAAGTAGELAGRLTEAADVRHALVLAADLPGAEALRALNAVGALSEQTGAAAAQLVDRVGAAIRAETRSRRAVEVELAPALATTRLLAGLPLVGLLMGGALGADTVHVLVRTRPGLACFAVAAGLEVAGLLWCRAIRRRAVG